MGILSDRDIKLRLKAGQLKIEPIKNMEQIGPASFDVRLGDKFRAFNHAKEPILDPAHHLDKAKNFRMLDDGVKLTNFEFSHLYENCTEFVLHPGEFIIASIFEYLELPSNLLARISGRSSLSRLGLLVTSMADVVEPCFQGYLTIGIRNAGKTPIKLYPGMRIAQLVFEELTSEPEKTYLTKPGAKYGKLPGATESRIQEDVEFQQKTLTEA